MEIEEKEVLWKSIFGSVNRYKGETSPLSSLDTHAARFRLGILSSRSG
jgi:hypothetical protein